MCINWPGSDILAMGYSNLANCVSIDVKQNIPDWKTYLMTKLVGANTLPVDFYLKVKLHAAWHIHLALSC